MIDRFKTFTVLVNRVSRNIRKIKNQEMANYQLRSPHISCLYYLYLAGGLTATELCEWCEEDKATISRSIDYLEKNGYLYCEAKTPKRYKSKLILTEQGAEVGKKIADKIQYVFEEVGSGLSEEERIQFYRSFTMISDGLEAIAKTGQEKRPPDSK